MSNEKQMTIFEHLGALRKVLVISAIATAITSVVGWIYAEKIITLLTAPVTSLKYDLIVISITEALFTKLKVAVFAGVLLALPIILYQLWAFLLPALKTSEKKYLRYLVPASFLLFIGGVSFGFKVVFPLGVKVLLTTFVVGGITPMVTLSNYLSFAIAFLLPFGLIFELPLIILFLSKLGIVSPKYLKEKRKYAILIIFIVAAALTPGPDIISQLLMAAPMYILYEASIIVSRFVYKKRETLEEEPKEEEPAITVESTEGAPEIKEPETQDKVLGANDNPGEDNAESSEEDLFEPTDRTSLEKEEHLENILDTIVKRGENPKE